MSTTELEREREVIIQVALDLESRGHYVQFDGDGLLIKVDGTLYVSVI